MRLLVIFLLFIPNVWAQESDSTACSVTNLKHQEEAVQTPDLFQPPPALGFPGGAGGLATGCRGWNACPCKEDCRNQKIASCKPESVS